LLRARWSTVETNFPKAEAGSFYRIRLHRNNQDYRLLLSICEMIHHYALPQEQGHGMRFIDFNDDQMWKLLQLFVTTFYRRKQPIYSVNPDAFPGLISRAVLRKNSIVACNPLPAATPFAPTLNLYRSLSERNRP
jgi:hypothetical protein